MEVRRFASGRAITLEQILLPLLKIIILTVQTASLKLNYFKQVGEE